MKDVGLTVEFDGKKNVVMAGDIVKEYPIGGMICEYARLHPTELKGIIMDSPFFNEIDLKEKGGDALMWFYNALLEKYGPVTAGMVITDFSNLLTDLNLSEGDDLATLLDFANENHETDEIKKFILKDTGFENFGISTIGQAFLTAYCHYSYSYVSFKYTFNMLASEEEFDEGKVMMFWSFYGENTDFQHIDFKIMMYDKGFHSLYTIKSSMSLIIFEAAHAMDAQVKFVKCKNCGKYFVPVGRADSIYCSYPSPQDKGKACRDIGAQATRARKMKNDTVTQEYRRLYMRIKMAIKRHPENSDYKKSLENLTQGMKEHRRQREEGEISTDDILEWLNSFDDSMN